jgi:hypothetical protein
VKPGLILGKQHRLREFVNRVLKRIFGPKRQEVTGGGDCIVGSFIICTRCRILLERKNQRGYNGQDTYHAWRSLEMNTKF